jgi:uncharacterized SAM-binding protein YcdF (DUF218 family)
LRLKTTLTTILLAAVLLLALFLWRGGHWLIVETPLQPADAIVVLMGSTPERELEAADLYNAGLADKLLMVEFPSHSNLLLDSFNIDMPRGLSNTVSVLNQLHVPTTSIHILPGDVSSTRGEAIAIATFLQENPHIQSIILVSSPSHMRRATLVFRRTFRRGGIDCVIIPRPTSYGNFHPKGWYRDRDSAKDVLYEYIKIAGWVLGL